MSQEQKKFLQGHSMMWRVNTAAFLKEVFDNYPANGGIFYQPANIFRELLAMVSERATELNDPVMNALMCRLALFGEADPYSPDYDHDMLQKTIHSKAYQEWRKKHTKNYSAA